MALDDHLAELDPRFWSEHLGHQLGELRLCLGQGRVPLAMEAPTPTRSGTPTPRRRRVEPA